MAQAARNEVVEFSARNDIKGITETVDALHDMMV